MTLKSTKLFIMKNKLKIAPNIRYKKLSIFKELIISIAFILLAYSAQSQNISGEWTGLLYQETGGIRYEYYFTMNLKQFGNKIDGTSEIRFLLIITYFVEICISL